ncbi:Uncharacterised protein [uncultured archaeon]|nr:Uncharacterised protein [uncultured archaeon]
MLAKQYGRHPGKNRQGRVMATPAFFRGRINTLARSFEHANEITLEAGKLSKELGQGRANFLLQKGYRTALGLLKKYGGYEKLADAWDALGKKHGENNAAILTELMAAGKAKK